VYSTSVFYYTQRQIVVLLSGNSPRSYMPVYAKPLTLHKGVDNQLQFQFLNQEQKPVNITGVDITCRILNYQGNQVLLQKALTPGLTVNGICSLFVSPADLMDIDAQKCYYTLEIPVGSFDFPVFVDQNAGGRGDLNIVNSILPSFVPSDKITIPTSQIFPNTNPNAGGPSNNSQTVTYFSSVITTDDNPVITIQTGYDQFYGNVLIAGSTVVDNDWYPIQLHQYSNVSDTQGYVIHGYHPYIRMTFESNAGVVTNILAR
jgi:hypothetical protein